LRYHVFSANADRFLKFFHQVIRKKILNVYITNISTSPASNVATLPRESQKFKIIIIFICSDKNT